MDRCYDEIWMKEEDQSAYGPLRNNNCFHMDVQQRSHHEMNMVLLKKQHLMQKWRATLNEK